MADPQRSESKHLPEDPWSEMERAVRCLALAVPGPVYDDVRALWEAIKADHFGSQGGSDV